MANASDDPPLPTPVPAGNVPPALPAVGSAVGTPTAQLPQPAVAPLITPPVPTTAPVAPKPRPRKPRATRPASSKPRAPKVRPQKLAPPRSRTPRVPPSVRAAKARAAGKVSVLYALGGNFSIALLKLSGYLLSNSSSLFGETVHSFADTLNQALLLLGIQRSRRKPDREFSYGYGNERFLWALISACGIFVVGAGITFYRGVISLQDGHVAEIGPATLAILAASFVVELIVLLRAVRELRSANPGASIADALAQGDPVTIAVVYEDSAAVIGVCFAFAGVLLTRWTGNPAWDAVGSLCVATCIGVVAILLINKNRQFLLGKSIPSAVQEQIIEMLNAEPCIEKVMEFKSSILDVGRYHVKCDVEWNGAGMLDEIFVQEELDEAYARVSESYEEFKKYVAYTTNRIPRLIGRKIDEIERKIAAAFPEVEHIDIEIN